MQACIKEGNLRDACKLVADWHLQSMFPNLEAQYKQRTMERLLGRNLWSAAAGYAISNQDFQVNCSSPAPHREL